MPRGFRSESTNRTEETDIKYDSIEMETEGAILFLIDEEEIWIPRSICVLDEKMKTVTVPVWFAKKNSLA